MRRAAAGNGVPEMRSGQVVTLRLVGSALPLGFVALVGATTLLSARQLGWLPAADDHQIGLVLLAFVVPLQFLAAVFALLARDTAVGTGMGILTGTWGATGLVLLLAAGRDRAPLGVLFVVSGCRMLGPAAAAAAATLVAAAVLTTTAVRFGATAAAELGAGHAVTLAAGWIGLLLAGVAGYAALALLLEDAAGRAVLPTGRRGRGVLGRGDDGRPREPGVRGSL